MVLTCPIFAGAAENSGKEDFLLESMSYGSGGTMLANPGVTARGRLEICTTCQILA
jgi:hypothetical protein